jgi:hypothetical protein
MAGSLDQLVRDLRGFEGRREVTKALRARIRKPVPQIRRAIKARALDTLPRRGGLNAWVASTRVTTVIRLAGRAAGVRLKGGRNSSKTRSDIRATDRGRVRAPSWGRRGAGAWHNQTVTPGFFTEPAADVDAWRTECVAAVDEALEVVRRG